MSELTRRQIEELRDFFSAYPEGETINALCDMALAWLEVQPRTDDDTVRVPRENGMLVEWLRKYWSAFCSADAIPVALETFTTELEAAGLIEWRKVKKSDLESGFASELGIEKGGSLWALTEAGRAMIAEVK